MSIIYHLIDLVTTMNAYQIALGLTVISAFILVVEDRRISILPLLMQYVLLSLLINPQIYRPIVFVRLGLGLAVCFLLYITAGHVQREISSTEPETASEATAGAPIHINPLANMGVAFRLLVMILGGFVAYGLWKAYPLPQLPAAQNLVSYWLISIGLLLALTGSGPLRMGLGLLTFINGFEGIYLFLEKSLLVIGLLGIVDVFLALAVTVCSESWLETLRGEAVK